MNCLECGNKIGAFRRKFSERGYCSEACLESGEKRQQQAVLALLLTNKKRQVGKAKPKRGAPPKPLVLAGYSSSETARHDVPRVPRAFTTAMIPPGRTRWSFAAHTQPPPGVGLVVSGARPAPNPVLTHPPRHRADPGSSPLAAAIAAPRLTDILVTVHPVWIDRPADERKALARAMTFALSPVSPSGRRPDVAVHCAFTPRVISIVCRPALAGAPSPKRVGGLRLASVAMRERPRVPGTEGAGPFPWKTHATFDSRKFAQPSARRVMIAPSVAHAPQPFARGQALFRPHDETATWLGIRPALHTLVAHARAPAGCTRASYRSVILHRAQAPAAHAEPGLQAEEAIWRGIPPAVLYLTPRIPVHGFEADPARPASSSYRFVQPATLVSAGRAEEPAWHFQARMIPRGLLQPIPPPWRMQEAPAAVAAAAAVVSEPVWSDIVRKPSAILEFLKTTPRWMRHGAWVLPLGVCAILTAHGWKTGSSGFFASQNQSLALFVRQHATVDFEDDFRSGLNQWTGDADWAKTWSYDGTGQVHPGKLALLESTRELTNYRFAFEGEIERHALGWVYRAADTRNYYASKLVVMGRGNNPSLALERWTVIDGHAGTHVQLPLPILPGATTMHRVITDVRDSGFTTYLDNRIVDTWSDAALARGGVGFFNDRGDAAGLSHVQVTDRDNLLGRFFAQLSIKFADSKGGSVTH